MPLSHIYTKYGYTSMKILALISVLYQFHNCLLNSLFFLHLYITGNRTTVLMNHRMTENALKILVHTHSSSLSPNWMTHCNQLEITHVK
jgi:hypothetical protein